MIEKTSALLLELLQDSVNFLCQSRHLFLQPLKLVIFVLVKERHLCLPLTDHHGLRRFNHLLTHSLDGQAVAEEILKFDF